MPSDLPGDISGQHPLQNWLNRLKRSIARRTPLPGNGYRIRQNEHGFTLEFQTGGSSSETVAQQEPVTRFTIEQIYANYLVCRRTNVVPQEVAIYAIAKPPHLRASTLQESIGGTTISYQYTNSNLRLATAASNDSEFQRILPAYEVNGEIYAVDTRGSTGISRNDPLDGGATGSTISHIELNLFARAWASTTLIPSV